MRIATIIPTFNAEPTLARAIESFTAQTHEDKELIVIDGGSSDGTLALLREHGGQIADWLSEPDNGILDAWNKGIARASGEWIHFLGADDYYEDAEVFAKVAQAIGSNPTGSKIHYGSVDHVDAGGRRVRRIGEPWDARRFRRVGLSIPHQGVFHHRSLFEEYGPFQTGSSYLTYEFLLRYLKAHDAVFLPEMLVARVGIGGVSNDPDHQLAFRRAYVRAQRLHGTAGFSLEAWWEWSKAAAKLALRKILPDRASLAVIDAIRQLLGKQPMWRG